ncbi:MAG: DUF2179 domain-containing protein [Thermovirgaceae bacterium]
MDLVGLFLIFCSRLLDVSLGTFRILLLVRGRKAHAAFTAFFESGIYLVALGYVLKNGITSPLQIVAYAGGFAVGNYLGVLLESKLLSSFVLVEVITPQTEAAMNLVNILREEGFGTTVIHGEGKAGDRLILKILCQRSEIPHISGMIGNTGFVFVSDVRGVWGGHFRQKRK